MRVAVISDIHGNLHALEAVLADIEPETPDEIWCLGDVVGYGPRPNECADIVRERSAVVLVGNHDLAAIGKLDTADFGPLAAESAHWTERALDAERAAWLRSLEPTAAREGIELYHGSARDPVWEYVLSEDIALATLRATTAPIVLVGHSHVALALSTDGQGVEGGLARGGTELETAGARWLLNPGSVGQPRDGDPRAAWLLIDITAGRAAFRRVPYPIEETQAEMRAAGLPEDLAVRLERGV
ncbi:MAG: metallophosphoesterase family protein [Thermoleophilia bacterium]|nr:metallophosphoesterase family protein [Thermoleophilia bacterium]